MKTRLPCEFFLIRYVPDVVKGEFTNIGVLLREVASGKGTQQTAVQFTRDWSRVRCMDATADVELLEALEGEIASRLHADIELKPVMQVLQDTLANSLQITPARACLAESLPAEMAQLMKMYVEPLKVKTTRQRTGRAAITAAMRTEFERTGVWPLMRKRIAASLYTAPGDPLKLDCGYKKIDKEVVQQEDKAAVIRIFHAVSLEGDLEAAKVLAFSAPQLREGIARVEQATLELTAIIESMKQMDDDTTDSYRFGVDTMERQAIRVMTVADLARIAETARVELRI